MKLIPLSKGLFAKVDDDDFDKVSALRWHAIRRSNCWHAMRSERHGGYRKTVYMHRFIVGAKPDLEVDHRNGDGLDNQKHNLRECTKRRNGQNRKRLNGKKSSRFHGVSLCSKSNKWLAVICAGATNAKGYAKQIYIGRYATEDEAARAYDAAAIRHFGEFASLNFPLPEAAE